MKPHTKIDRRAFLKASMLTAGGIVLQACQLRRDLSITPQLPIWPTQAMPFPVGSPLPTTGPQLIETDPPPPNTSTPAPTHAEVLASEVAHYAAALGLDASEVSPRIENTSFTDVTGTELIAAVDPATGTPLLLRQQDGTWEPATLKLLGTRAGIAVGVLIDQSSMVLLQREFTYGMVTSGWDWSTQPESRTQSISYRWEDNWIAQAHQQGITSFRIQHILFPSNPPEWLRDGRFAREELTEIMVDYVTRFVQHFRGAVQEFVVVNEPFRGTDVFLRTIGENYIDIAFRAAREADPTVTLMFNDTDNHRTGGYSTVRTREVLARLKAKGLVDKVGLQMHLAPGCVGMRDDIVRVITGYGLPAAVTEFDFDLRDIRGDPLERYSLQAKAYEIALGAAVEAGVKDIAFWGAQDSASWLESPEFQGSPRADPNLFDDFLEPKPSYYAVRRILLGALLS
jgi:GH35 family endo-1,4-beta-xylanase